MSETRQFHIGKASVRTSSRAGQWLRGLALVALLGWGQAVCGQTRDEQYAGVFSIIEQADTLQTKGKTKEAAAKYQEALSALDSFRRKYPDWNANIIAFRLKYLADKVATNSENLTSGTKEVGTAGKAAEGSSVAQVKLLDAGSEPRKELRLHPSPGDKQGLVITITSATDIKLGEMPNQEMKLPGMKMNLEATVKSVSPAGEITYEVVMSDMGISDDPGVSPQIAEAMKAALAGFKGFSGSGTMSARGVAMGTDIKLPAGADPQLSQAMQQMKDAFSNMTAPLPEEAVGQGAKWEVRMPMKSQGMTIDQTTVYQLVSLEGDRLTVKSTVTQSAANQKIQNPAMPGLKMDVSKMSGSAQGEVTLDQTKVLPLEANSKGRSEFSMAMNAGGQKQTMEMKVDFSLKVESK